MGRRRCCRLAPTSRGHPLGAGVLAQSPALQLSQGFFTLEKRLHSGPVSSVRLGQNLGSSRGTFWRAWHGIQPTAAECALTHRVATAPPADFSTLFESNDMRHTSAHQPTSSTAPAAAAAAADHRSLTCRVAGLSRTTLLVAASLLAGTAQAAIITSSAPVLFHTNETLKLGNQTTGPTLANKSTSISRSYTTTLPMGGVMTIPMGTDYTASFNFTAKETGKFTDTARATGDVIDITAGFSPSPLANYSQLVYLLRPV